MLNHRVASFEDARSVLSNLCDVTKSEIEAIGLNANEEEFVKTLLACGPAEISLWDKTPIAIFGHYPIGPGFRHTWCFAGKAVETLHRETLLAASSQVKRILADYPQTQFTSVSYSQHPKRDWFFAVIGFHKRIDFGDKAIFDLLPLEDARLDS
jgi:hypothetical protein